MSEVAKEYLEKKQQEIRILQFDLSFAVLNYGITKLFFDISNNESADKKHIERLDSMECKTDKCGI